MFRTLTLADAVYVAERMRSKDWECIRACTTIESAEVFALNRWQTQGPAWTHLNANGEPIAIGGISMVTPWNGVAWFVATDRMDSYKKTVRLAHTVFRNAAKAVPRLECSVLAGWTEAERFAKRLGFEPEGVRKRAGRDGQDVLTLVYRPGNE